MKLATDLGENEVIHCPTLEQIAEKFGVEADNLEIEL